MKKIIFIFLFFSCLFVFGQSKSDVGKYIESANTQKIISHSANSLDLDIPGSKGVYDKNQAQVLLSNFFKKNKPKKYFVKHKGGSQEKKFFEIGSLLTEKDNFRVYFLYDLVEEQTQIIELRIELSE